MEGSIEPRIITTTNGAITIPSKHDDASSSNRPRAARAGTSPGPTTATKPKPDPEQPRIEPAQPSQQQGDDAEQSRAQTVIERDSLGRPEAGFQLQPAEHQVAQADRRRGDQAGGQHDRHALGQVFDVAQLLEAVAQKRLAECGIRARLRETP